MQDLEETVLSLKRVLNERERELGEYQAKTRTLETDLSRERSRENATPVPRLESREEVGVICTCTVVSIYGNVCRNAPSRFETSEKVKRYFDLLCVTQGSVNVITYK